MSQQTYELVPIDDLKPHPRNPRRGDVEEIRKSIRANGFYGAIIYQASTRYIVVGEHRWRAAQAEGLTEVPAIAREMNDDEAYRVMLADNKLTDISSYDDQALVHLLQDAQRFDDDLSGTGYSVEELDRLLAIVNRNQGLDLDEVDNYDKLANWTKEHRTPDERESVFHNTTIRQITLVMKNIQYEHLIDAFHDLMEREGLTTNTAVVDWLLRTYEEGVYSYESPGDAAATEEAT